MTSIPEPIKRIVRKDAGFGCCKCGLPIIQYHHIVRRSSNPDDIMLLCPTHHHEATVGAMLEKEQRNYREHPYNIERGYVEGQFKVNQETPVITVGNNQFIGYGNFLLVDDENLLSIEIDEGVLQLSMKLYDKRDTLVADIERNEWISGNPLPWDLESSFQWLRIRRKLRDIQLEIDAREYPISIRANMWRKGQNFQIDPKILLFNGVVKEAGLRNLCLVALRLEVDTSKGKFSIAPDPRFGKGHIVAEHNIETRIKKGLKAWQELICKHEFITIINRKWYSVRECRKCNKLEKIWKS